MTPSAEKLGLFLPEGLHQDMLFTAQRLNRRKNPRGCVRLIYERAFRELVEALDRGDTIVFPAVRGAKDRVSVRLSRPLCLQIRRQTDALNLKLTDFAFTAIQRFLHSTQGPAHDAPRQDRPGPRQD
ncbi:hypothetical protein [Phenylobacterium conjunctum]|uniref:Uncharacterized protein n=1 Tax=Phenylobacterium conjunctum TaxID=1298959 RepID=A0ABW3T4B2_9CAUL